jgi:putative spermidine/putrescine transport system permease protein
MKRGEVGGRTTPGPDNKQSTAQTRAKTLFFGFQADHARSSVDVLGLPWTLFGLPAAFVIAVIFAAPVGWLVLKSFARDAGRARLESGFTIDNYIRFFSDWFYLSVLVDTLVLGSVVVATCIVLGYPVAYFLVRTRTRFRGLLIFLVIAPLLISVVIRNLGWVPLLSANGPINWGLLSLGLVSQPVKLINNFAGVAIGLVHSLLPYMILTLMAVIHRIDRYVEEAALNLGATPWQVFRTVILPLSRPGLVGGYLLVLTATTSAFTTPAVLGGRRVLVMPIFIEQQMRSALLYGFGATAATVLMVTAILLTVGASYSSRTQY